MTTSSSTKPKLPIRSTKVLSIQSHVVHGYVGNKACSFPLQTLNWDVDVLNSVNFSNHTGYGKWEGNTVNGKAIKSIYDGLKDINMDYDALLTGYIHGHDALKAVGDICIDIKKRNPETLWVLDPVMGDEGQLYVSKSVIPIYRDILKSGKVDIITPNQFELELLLDQEIKDIQTLKIALKKFHKDSCVKHVVISSLTLTGEELGFNENEYENSIYCCISSIDLDDLMVFQVEKFNSYFTGVGDLFSALLMDRMFKTGDIVASTNQVLSVMSKVLFVTRHLAYRNLGKNIQGKIGDFETMKECELRIVECRDFYCDQNEYHNPVVI